MATKEKMLSLIRRWFLPALFLLAALPAPAITRPLSETRVWPARDFAPASARAGSDFDAERQGVYRPFNGEQALNPSIDPDGRCFEKGASAVGNYLYSGGSYGQEYRDASSILNYIGDNTSSPTLAGLMGFASYFTDKAANNVTPASYVNQAVSDYNAAGGGVTGVLGVGNRYNPTASAYDFFSGYDLINGQTLSGVDRASAGLNTLGGTLLIGAGFADSFTPGTTPTPPPAAPSLLYHYTTAPEASFANGLWEGSSVSDTLYTDPVQASQELGIPVPNKVIPIQNTGQFVPNTPPIVDRSFRFQGGGNDFINPQPVPPSQILPARPIGGN